MRLKYTFENVELEDQIVAVPLGEGADQMHGIIKMNEVAAFIFELLKEETTEETIIDAMEKEYNVPRSVLVADVHRYVEDFMKKGLVVE